MRSYILGQESTMRGDSYTFFQQGIGPLDLKSADSILKAAGRDPARNEIDKIAMLRGISLCHQWYSEAPHADYDAAVYFGKPRLYSPQTVKPRSKDQSVSPVLSNRAGS